MKTSSIALLAALVAAPAFAEETHREMGAHVHGVSQLEIAIEHGAIEFNLVSPGADIVGFETEASSDEQMAAVEAAIKTLVQPEMIIGLPEAAECSLNGVLAHIHGGHHDEEHDAHMHEGEGHEHEHEGEGHEHEHEGEGHEHEHEHEHEGEGHEHEHEGHDHEHGEHNEYHMNYTFACHNEDAITEITFPFFEHFANAKEIEVQYVTEEGAGAAELTADAPKLTLE